MTLPKFDSRNYPTVKTFISKALSSHDAAHLLKLISYPDGHYRAIFSQAYFVLAEGATEPSKSQWSTLKKRLKRLDPTVFVFKQHGINKEGCYLDFGFFPREH